MQAIFFILAVSFYGSFSVPLQPMESTDLVKPAADPVKEDSQMNQQTLLSAFKPAADPVKEDSQMNATDVRPLKNFMADLIANPEQFIAQVTKLDPVELQKIIALLIDLKGTSEAREAALVLAVETKNTEYANTGNAIVDANQAVIDAQSVVTDAQGVVVVKQADLASATAAHAAKGIEKNDAQKAHDDEKPSLDDEQQVLSDVISMLEGLHPTPPTSTPEAGELLLSMDGYSYYKVQVTGVMLSTNVVSACETNGMKALCSGPDGCGYNDGSCLIAPLSNSCGNPMSGVSKRICNGNNPNSCPQLNDVFNYMLNWNSGSSCGAIGSNWCATGSQFSNKFALCVK